MSKCIILISFFLSFGFCSSITNPELKLTNEDFKYSTNDSIFNHIADKIYALKWDYNKVDSLKNPLRNLIHVYYMHGQVENGGVVQFVDNGTGDKFTETIEALNEIKAIEYVEILKEYQSIFPNQFLPKDNTERREVYDKIWLNISPAKEKELTELLEKLDNKYYENDKFLKKKVIDYAKTFID